VGSRISILKPRKENPKEKPKTQTGGTVRK
jgi:hypothetical protein